MGQRFPKSWLASLLCLALVFPTTISTLPALAQLGEMRDPENKPAPTGFALPPAGVLSGNSAPEAPPATMPKEKAPGQVKAPEPNTVSSSPSDTALKAADESLSEVKKVPGPISEPSNPPKSTAQPTNETQTSNAVQAKDKTLPTVTATAIPSNKDLLVAAAGHGTPHEYVLGNGLKVLILECHEFPIVSHLIWYRVGSRDEEPGATGLSHLVEHLLFQNVGSFSGGEIGSTVARNGGQFNGYTSDDFTTFFETLPASKLELAIKIESERMRSAKFSEPELLQELSNIGKELDNEAKDPMALVSKEVRALMFMQHPYHNPTIGWRTEVESLKVNQVKDYYDRFFHPNNATLIIAGDVQPKAALLLLQKYFGPIPKSQQPISHTSVVEPMPRSERRVSLKYGGKQEIMQIAYRSPALSDSDAAAMVVMEKLLNGGNNGRLKSKLLDGKICTSANASYEIKKESGLFTITGCAVPATLNAQQKVQEGLDTVIAQLRDKPLSEAELKRAKNLAEFAFFSECDGPYRAGFHLGYFDSLNNWQTSYAWTGKIRAVTANDITRVAKKYFNNDARVIGWIAGTAAPKAAPQKTTGSGDLLKEHEKSVPSKHPEHLRLTGYKDDDAAPAPEGNIAKSRDKKSGIPAVIRDIPQAVGNVVTGNIPGAVGNVGSALINIPSALGNISTAVGSTASVLGKQIALLYPNPDNTQNRVVKRVLKNGVTLYVFESHISPIIQVNGSLAAGDIYCLPDKPGVSSVAAAILNQGTSKRGKAQSLSGQDDLGIPLCHMLKFENGQETIDFQTRCLSRDLSTQLDLIAESLSSPLLEDSGLDKAKQEALASYRRSEDSLNQKVDRALMQSLFAENSPYRPKDPSEKAKSISATTLADVQKFFAANIVSSGTKIVIAGDITPDLAQNLAEKSFTNWNGKASHDPLRAHLNSRRILRTSIPIKDSKKHTICFGQLIPLSPSQPDYGNLLIADNILVNHPMVSRLEQQLSKSPMLEASMSNAEVSVKLDPVSNMTRWSLSMAVEPNAVPLWVKTIKNELRLLSKTGISPSELNESKRYLLGYLPLKTAATLSSVAKSMLDSAEHSDTADAFMTQIAAIKSATPEGINKVIRTAFKPDQSTLVIAGSAQTLKAARTLEGNKAAPQLGNQAPPIKANQGNSIDNARSIKPGNNPTH